MPRGYWCALIAAFGLLAIAGPSRSQSNANRYQTKAQQQAANTPSNIAATQRELAKKEAGSKETEECQPGDDKRYSDLCAQWKAADAARLGAIVNGLGFAAVLVALWLAFRSNAIARDTARMQLRAYVAIDFGCHCGIEEGKELSVWYGIRNVGQTPALFFRGLVWTYMESSDHIPEFLELDDQGEIIGDRLGPTKMNDFHDIVTSKLTKREFAELKSGKKAVFVTATFYYRDVFGKQHLFRLINKSKPDLADEGMLNVLVREDENHAQAKAIHRWLSRVRRNTSA